MSILIYHNNMDQKTKIRKYINNKLKEIKMSKAEFYRKCGFSRATYYNITANPVSMTIGQIDKICEVLDISYVEFGIVIGRINPFDLLHPMTISKAKEILYENKTLLKTNNIKVVNLTDEEIKQIASILEMIMSLISNK